MKVHHFCTVPYGGAATAALRLHDALRDQDVDSIFWTTKVRSETQRERGLRKPPWIARRSVAPGTWLPQLQQLVGKRVYRRRLKQQLAGRPAGLDLFSLPQAGVRTLPKFVRKDDVVNLHWIPKFVDFGSFFEGLTNDQPVVWTLHDMNPFTGGCHYNHGCRRFESGCGSCPQLGTPAPDDLSAQSFQLKREALASINLTVISPSRWLLDEAKRSPVFAAARSFQRIPYGLDTECFRPRNRQQARQSLGLDPDRYVIGVGAAAIDCRRKGVAEAVAALGRLEQPECTTVVVFGGGANPDTPLADAELEQHLRGRGMRFHRAGFVSGGETLAELYSALDVFLLPSLEDNLPQTGLEAMACGVPNVAFDAGGISDFVRPNETGLLAPVGDTDTLADHLNALLQFPAKRQRLALQCREVARREYDEALQAQRYHQLYHDLHRHRQAA